MCFLTVWARIGQTEKLIQATNLKELVLILRMETSSASMCPLNSALPNELLGPKVVNSMEPTQSNPSLYNAIKDRGTAYLMVFRELKKRYGEDVAKDVMRSASRAHGLAIGKSLARYAPRDFEGMAEGFAKSPDNGSIFCPHIRQLDSTCLEVKMMACPIKDAWVDAGCSDEEIVTLLSCASALDEATLEAAGFDYEIELWSPGKIGCCLTRIAEKSLG